MIVHVRLLVVQENAPGLEATAYELTAAPPSLVGALQDTMSDPGPYAALTLSGTLGVVAGVTGPLDAEADPVPAAFVATTLKVYEIPFVRPVTVHEYPVALQVFDPGDDVTV